MKFKIFLTVFAVLSLYTTVTKQNLYPINAYQMFSKNWLGLTITGIEAADSDGRRLQLWTHARVPFFQVNNVAHRIFSDGTEEDKAAFCQWVRGQTGNRVLSLYQVDRKYVRVVQRIDDTPVVQRRIYQCSTDRI